MILLIGCEKNSSLTGQAIYGSDASSDNFEIQKADLKECCTFIDEQGLKKTCSVLKRFDCDYCESVC
ncbi:MAG: hypothetical protein KKC26_02085 [Nanoarchaeota archaeon]|nr:hypothetical protein [Nanoarchaeota archaeon]